MRTHETDIQTVRALLDRYYDGACTPGEERRLRDFFAAAEHSALPPDLQADAAMMSALNEADDNLCMMADPDKIAEAYMSAATVIKKGRGRRSRLMMLWNPAAAAIIAAVVATVFVFTAPKNSSPAVTDIPENAVAAADDPYVEIDNAEEADRLLNETFALIGKRMAFAHKTVSKTGGKIDKTNSTVKNILKNEKI